MTMTSVVYNWRNAMADEAPASWRSIRYGSPVVAADGSTLGTVVEVLGSDAEDVFHGIRLRVAGSKSDLEVLSDDVTEITTERVVTGLAMADLGSLEVYDETASYHVSSVGRFRHHLGWKKDSGSDEEPG